MCVHTRLCPSQKLSPIDGLAGMEQSPPVPCSQQSGSISAEPGLVPERSWWWLLQGGTSPLLPGNKGLARFRRCRGKKDPLLTSTVLLSPEGEHWWRCPRERWRQRCDSSSAVSSSSGGRWQARDAPAKKACWWHLGDAGEEAIALLSHPVHPKQLGALLWAATGAREEGSRMAAAGQGRMAHPAAGSKGPQLVTSARKPLMPRPGAGRFTPGTHFPSPSQKAAST